MSSIRPILPRPAPSDDPDFYDADGSAGAVGRSGRKKIERISQACEVCRKKKVKCDGLRPVCTPCSMRKASCEYVSPSGQSKLDIANSRLDAYGVLLTSLRKGSLHQASALLEQIRSSDDDDDILSMSQLEIADKIGPHADIGNDVHLTPRLERREGHRFSDNYQRDGQPISLRQRVDPIGVQNSALLHIDLPPAETTKGAVDFFFEASSRLFHVFSPEHLGQCFVRVYHTSDVTPIEKMAAIACLASAAAVGCQYSNGEFNEATEKALYNASRHCLDVIVENSPLDAIGVCSLLAMYNVMGKGTVALVYVEIGLSMARLHGLYERKCPRPNMTHLQWVAHRKAWRALIFFSSWLGATLGYVSGNDTLITTHLSEMNVDDSVDIEDIVQAELTKISLLKVTVLRLHLSFKNLTQLTVDSILNDLNKWHSQLPRQMQLVNISSPELSLGLRRTIYYAHLLYLGAVMLVYRLVAYRTQRAPILNQPHDATATLRTHSFASHGIAAAQNSAHILEQLMADNGIFRRCWLVMFQGYTSCLALLHTVVQGQLHRLPRAQWEKNLRLASKCLAVLEHCGQMDQVAYALHSTLVTYYMQVSDYSDLDATNLAPGGGSATISEGGSPPEYDWGPYLLHVPSVGNPRRIALAKELLHMLCVPFGSDNVREHYEKLARTPGWHPDPTCYEHPQWIERLDRDSEGETRLFDTGAENLISRHRGGSMQPDPTRFLGHPEPHGWSLEGFPATYDMLKRSSR